LIIPVLPIAAIPVLETFSYTFRQSDLFARSIVVFLIFVSAYVWIVFLNKRDAVRRALKDNRRFVAALERVGMPLEMSLQINTHAGPLRAVYEAALQELRRIFGSDGQSTETWARHGCLPRPLSTGEAELVRNAMQRTADAVLFELERGLGGLNTAVTVSPFLGLLGTVWGVMLTFTQMAAKAGRPDIRAMAPGVSGALLTTVVGLLVAIPALVGYNYLAQSVRRVAADMDCFAEDFLAQLRAERGREAEEFSVRRRVG